MGALNWAPIRPRDASLSEGEGRFVDRLVGLCLARSQCSNFGLAATTGGRAGGGIWVLIMGEEEDLVADIGEGVRRARIMEG